MAKIFILEDNEPLREAIASYLSLEDHEVTEFGRIAGFENALRNQNPDLLILDVMLPDGNGFNLAKKLKQEKDYPVIFLTALACSLFNSFNIVLFIIFSAFNLLFFLVMSILFSISSHTIFVIL